MPNSEKTCIRCKKEKPLAEFNKNRTRPDGHECYCRQCVKEMNKASQASRSACAKKYKAAARSEGYYASGGGRWSALKNSAKTRGLAFDLTKEQLKSWWGSSPDVCEYCRMTIEDYRRIRDFVLDYEGGDPEILKFKPLFSGRKIDILTIDRIDSCGGYTLGNLKKCCWICNSVKGRLLSDKHMKLVAKDVIRDLVLAYCSGTPFQPVDKPGTFGWMDQYFVKKGWGYEQWLYNGTGGYCGKILHFNQGKRCSYHYHLVKDEVFYLQSGCLLVEYGPDDDLNNTQEVLMVPGDVFHVPPGMRHRMLGVEESDLFEFSTTDRPEDSLRVMKGD